MKLHYTSDENLRKYVSRDLYIKKEPKLDKILDGSPFNFFPSDVCESAPFSDYYISLFGVLETGEKVEVRLIDILPSFDVIVPTEYENKDFKKFILKNFSDVANSYGDGTHGAIVNIKTIDDCMYLNDGYGPKCKACRVYTKTSSDRLNVLEKVLAYKRTIITECGLPKQTSLKTASDDKYCYYRKAAREFKISLNNWNLVSDYKVNYKDGKIPIISCKRANFKLSDYKNPDLSLVLAWDIETIGLSGEVPTGILDTDQIIIVGMSFHWKTDNEPLIRIAITDVDCNPVRDVLTIICKSKEEIIDVTASVFSLMRPEFMFGFNDGGYDWPFLAHKLRQFRKIRQFYDKTSLVPSYKSKPKSESDRVDLAIDPVKYYEEAWLKTKCRSADVKLSASDKQTINVLQLEGCVMIDVKIFLQKTAVVAEPVNTLKHHLKINNLGSKADLTIDRMWKYYIDALRVRPNLSKIDRLIIDAKQGLLAKINNLDVELAKMKMQINNQQLDESSKLSKDDFDKQLKEESELISMFGKDLQRCSFKTDEQYIQYQIRQNMSKAIFYCIIDSVQCQRLFVKKSSISETRELASLTYVSFNDAYLRGNSMKVTNLAGAYAEDDKILLTVNKPKFDGQSKFKGAYVFPPAKGLQNKRPVYGMDFASLYPSIFMAYNLSGETLILNKKLAEEAISKGLKVKHISFEYEGHTKNAWSVLDKQGLFPKILIDLKNRRKKIKVIEEELKTQHELIHTKKEADFEYNLVLFRIFGKFDVNKFADHIELTENNLQILTKINECNSDLNLLKDIDIDLLSDKFKNAFKYYLQNQHNDIHEFIKTIEFDKNALNSKQKAIKLMMNSFYGVTGASFSSLFVLELAGSVTTMGQFNIKMIADFVLSKDYVINYGDTDSLYLSSPDRLFINIDKQYEENKITRLEYFTEMMKITMGDMQIIKKQINDKLFSDNGTKYLEMAYEEVLFPVVFTGKKKYFGLAHEKEINFERGVLKLKDMFIRGIEIIKRGQTEFCKKIGERIMRRCLTVENELSLEEIVKDELTNAIRDPSQWCVDDFVKSAVFRPSRNNISTHTFVNRMKIAYETDKLKLIPDPGERFDYLIVQRSESDFDLEGRKLTVKIGDRMEYKTVVQRDNSKIDMSYYTKFIVSQGARFINYKYQETIDPTTGIIISDAAQQKLACKELTEFAKHLIDKPSENGTELKRKFKETLSDLSNQLTYTTMYILDGPYMDFRLFARYKLDEIYSIFVKSAKYFSPLSIEEML